MAEVKKLETPFSYPFPYKRIRVFPERDLRASILELSMIDTRIMQRLRNTKQLGNSNISYPTADHSRFSHSLGVLYWANKILTALNDNHNSIDNVRILREMNVILQNYFQQKFPTFDRKIFSNSTFLGVSWFEQLARLYALLHDITHIPFGHTIEDQAELFDRHDDDINRLNFVFDMLKAEVKKSYHFEDLEFRDELTQIAIEYICLVQSMFAVGYITHELKPDEKYREVWLKEWDKIDKEIQKPLLLTYDIVSNTICADLMDYTLRDTLYCSMPKSFDKILLIHLKIVNYKTTFYETKLRTDEMPRLGISISRKKVRHDAITAILELLRIRYDLAEKVYYHHTKVIADAMLEKILRSLKEEKDEFKPEIIYEKYLGDEGFINLLESKLTKPDLANIREILDKVLRRNLYKAVFRVNKNPAIGKTGQENISRCNSPEGRDGVEKEIIEELSSKYNVDLEHGDIIISHPPLKMQKKIAKALIEWSNGRIYTFEKLPTEVNYSNEVSMLTDRYETLWSINVFLNPSKIKYVRLLEAVCEAKFDIYNDPILKDYLKRKYKKYYSSQKTMNDINHQVMAIEASYVASETGKGKSNLEPIDGEEYTETAYEEAIAGRRKARKSPQKKPSKKGETANTKFNFDDKEAV